MKKGFTLSEIMVVVCIIAIVASTAMPAIDSFMSSQKVSAEGEAFVSNVRMARYKAMQENALHRLVFDEDDSGNVSGYKIQAYGEYDDEDENFNFYGDSDDSDVYESENSESHKAINKTDKTKNEYKEIDLSKVELADNKWHSILDYDEIVINADVEAKHSTNATQTVIYFYPSGYLIRGKSPKTISNYTSSAEDDLTDENLISEETLTFTYGNAKVVVHFNAMGILSSEILEIDASEDSDDDVGTGSSKDSSASSDTNKSLPISNFKEGGDSLTVETTSES